MNTAAPVPFGWVRAAGLGLTFRPITDADLPFLARVYASTRAEELAVTTLSASQKAVKENPERIKLVVEMHKKAVDHAMANQAQIVDMAVAKLGQQKKSVELAVPNVELAWKLDDVFMTRAKAYAQIMFDNKQLRQPIDLDKFVTRQFQ